VTDGTFHFLRPEWLAALPLVALAWWWLRTNRGRASAWAHVCRPEFVALLVGAQSGPSRRPGTATWLALAAMLALVALAGPTWEKLPAPVFRDDAPLVIAFDLSDSMLAEDVTPSRFERARFKIADLLNAREAGQTALVAYAAEAFAVTPLTTDADTITALLPALDPEIVPTDGTRPMRALDKAAQLIERAGIATGGDVLFVTDGLPEGDVDALVTRAAQTGVRVSVLGIGTPSGAPIPDPAGSGFLRDAGGVVIARLKTAPLERIAAETGGTYVTATADRRDVERLGADLSARIGGATRADDVGGFERWRDMGPWVLVIALPFAALAFRRNAVFALALGALLGAEPTRVEAVEWGEWFKNRDQRALDAFERQDYDAAAETFEAPEWQAATAYRQGDYERALEILSGLDDTESLYNRGNALAELERYDEAIAAYDEVLERDPDHADAAYNKAYLENLPKKPPQGGGGEGDSDEREAGEGQSSSESDSGSKPQKPSSESESGGEGESASQEGDSPTGERSGREPAGQDDEAREPESATAGEERETDAPEAGEREAQTAVADEDTGSLDERRQATEQWLRRIPDDPAGLLRRKFRYQYRQQAERNDYEGEPW